MTLRRTFLALALPALSLFVCGCNPPIDDANKAGGPAPAVDAPKTTPPVSEPAPADVKPKIEVTPTPEATPAPAEKPADAPPAEMPK